MRIGKTTLVILDHLASAAVSTVDLLTAIMSAGYGASYGKLNQDLNKIEQARERKTEEARTRQRYYSLLYTLRKQGLLEKKGVGNNIRLSITKKGLVKLKTLKKQITRSLPNKTYTKTSGQQLIIITFDIPEKEKRKREWLRAVLKNLGLKMIQKSVWMGKVKIPEIFLEDLRKLNLVECVEIFEISKSGSLEHLI